MSDFNRAKIAASLGAILDGIVKVKKVDAPLSDREKQWVKLMRQEIRRIGRGPKA